jgi:hypothetical protein
MLNPEVLNSLRPRYGIAWETIKCFYSKNYLTLSAGTATPKTKRIFTVFCGSFLRSNEEVSEVGVRGSLKHPFIPLHTCSHFVGHVWQQLAHGLIKGRATIILIRQHSHIGFGAKEG